MFFIGLTCLYLDPVLANKFETIGSGVTGSAKIKIEYLKVIAYVAAGLFFIASVLSVVTKNKNAQTLNYTMWKSSAIIFLILSILFLAMGIYL